MTDAQQSPPLTKEEALLMYDLFKKSLKDINIPEHETFYKCILALICIVLIWCSSILLMGSFVGIVYFALKQKSKLGSKLFFKSSDKWNSFFLFAGSLVTCILVGVLGIPANKKRLQDAYNARDESILKYRIDEVYALLPELSQIKITKNII